MCLAKSYASHISYLNQIESFSGNELLTTGVYDECIMKWYKYILNF